MNALEELQAMTDEQLDEAVALSQGWVKYPAGSVDIQGYPNNTEWWGGIDREVRVRCYNHFPTSDTVEGKAQAFDLMVKYGLWVEFNRQSVAYQVKGVWKRIKPVGLRKSIVIASILSAQENIDDVL